MWPKEKQSREVRLCTKRSQMPSLQADSDPAAESVKRWADKLERIPSGRPLHQYAQLLSSASAGLLNGATVVSSAEEVRTLKEAFFASVNKTPSCLGLCSTNEQQGSLPPFVLLCNLGGRQLLYQSSNSELVRLLPLAVAANDCSVAAAVSGLVSSASLLRNQPGRSAALVLFFSLPFHCDLQACSWEMRLLCSNANTGRTEDSGIGLRVHDTKVRKWQASSVLVEPLSERQERLAHALAQQVSAANLDIEPTVVGSEPSDTKLMSLVQALKAERATLLQSHREDLKRMADAHAEQTRRMQDDRLEEKRTADRRVAGVVDAAKASNEATSKKMLACESQKAAMMQQKMEFADDIKRLTADLTAAALTHEQDLKLIKQLRDARTATQNRQASTVAAARDRAVAMLEQAKAEAARREKEAEIFLSQHKAESKEKNALLDVVHSLRERLRSVEEEAERRVLEAEERAQRAEESWRELETDRSRLKAQSRVWKAGCHLAGLRIHKLRRDAEAESHMHQQFQKRNAILEERCTALERRKAEAEAAHSPHVSAAYPPYTQHAYSCAAHQGQAAVAGGPVDASLEATIANAQAAFGSVVQTARSTAYYKHRMEHMERSFYPRG